MENVSFEKFKYINALTINERVQIYKKLNIDNFSYAELQNWIDIRGVVSEDDIYKMIELNGMKIEDFNKGLKKLDDNEKKQVCNQLTNFNWFRNYEEIMNNYLNEEREVDVEKLDLSLSVSPFILWTGRQLKKEVDGLRNISLSQSALVKLIEKMIGVLLNLSMKTLVWELHLYGLENKEKFNNEEKEDEKFRNFVKDQFLNKQQLIDFYEKYPVIARRVTVKCIQIINHYKEMLTRIDSEFEEIKNKFDLKDISNKITDINCDQGDTHEEGRFVVKVNFGQDIIVYKPRNLKIEEKFNEFIKYINRNSKMLNLYVNNKAIYRNKYTFESYVKYEPCKTENEIIRFYRRFGEICALIYILKGNDIHYENIIASSEYPVIVDIETLFQHQSDVLNLGDNAFIKAYKECIHSVCGTALLPIITFAKNKNSKGVDISALNGGEQVLPYKMLSLKDVNKDTMRFDYDEVKISAANNIPVLNGKKVSFIKYVDYIIESFKECLIFIIENKNKIIGEEGIFNIFKDIPARHLLKATQTYAKMMAFSSHPNYSEDMIYLERLFSNIWNYNYNDKRAIKYEYDDMVWGDIPIFFGKVDSRDLISSKGEIVKDYFDESALKKAIKIINELTTSDIEKQVAQIKISLGQYEKINNERFAEIYRTKKAKEKLNIYDNDEDRNRLLKEAEFIGDKIADNAIYDENSNTITWNNVTYDDINECWKVRAVDNSLGDGLSGVLLFYYMLKKYSKSKRYDKLIESMLNSILTMDIPNNKNTPFESDLGMLYTLSIIYKDSQLDGIRIKIHKILHQIDKKICELNSNSIRDGYAGIINVMLSVYSIIEKKLVVEIIEKYLKTIIKKIDNKYIRNVDILNVLYILKKSNVIVKNKEIRDKYIELEDKIDIEEMGDINYKKVINDLNLLNFEDQYSGKIVLKDVFQYEKCSNDTLLEGSMYDLNILVQCLENKNIIEVKEIINEYVSQILYYKNMYGDYLYYGIEGYPGVGLLHGLSGIGYTLLRIYSGGKV